ncbi:uncharacterized protein ACB058_013658 isoform 2-T2 [Synchiropus picturatus]
MSGGGGDLTGGERSSSAGGSGSETWTRSGGPGRSCGSLPTVRCSLLWQVMLSGEESPEDPERRRRAQKRRDKKKRQKERRKLELEQRMQEAPEPELRPLDSDQETLSLISGSGSDEAPRKEEWKEVRPRNRRGAQLQQCWSTGNSNSEVDLTEDVKRAAESLAAQGIQLFQSGHYSQAVTLFTKAIRYQPGDHRFYGNRSYCYWSLKQFPSALTDAETAIQLAPDWPKGHFRKGCALMDLKRHEEAAKALEQVLSLDPRCQEASTLLAKCWLLQMMELGFEEQQSKCLLQKFGSVQAVLAYFGAKALKNTKAFQSSGCRSLWVGNIALMTTEKDLLDLFNQFVEAESVKILRESFCAFVNFRSAIEASKALDTMQDVELRGNKLVMRYPDRWLHRTLASVDPEHKWPSRKPL